MLDDCYTLSDLYGYGFRAYTLIRSFSHGHWLTQVHFNSHSLNTSLTVTQTHVHFHSQNEYIHSLDTSLTVAHTLSLTVTHTLVHFHSQVHSLTRYLSLRNSPTCTLSVTGTLTHSMTHSLVPLTVIQSNTRSLSITETFNHSLDHTPNSLLVTHSFTLTFTQSLYLDHSHPLPFVLFIDSSHSLAHSHWFTLLTNSYPQIHILIHSNTIFLNRLFTFTRTPR